MGPISGADETLVAYATQLRAAGHDVSVLLMFPHERNDPYYVRLREAGVPLDSIASASTRAALKAGRKLAARLMRALPNSQKLMRQQAQRISTNVTARYFEPCREYFESSAADLIHVVTPDPNAMVFIRAAHAAGLPVIYQELGTPYHPPAFEFYYEQFTSALPFCSEVVALSPRLLRECREKLPYANAVSLLPITTERLLNGLHAREPENGEITFGFAARVEELKGSQTLIEGFIGAEREAGNLRLRIAGDGTQKSRVAATAKAEGVADKCEFVGVYTDPERKGEFMRSIDVFVLPSTTEGTPNSIVEAMAYGMPIIASEVGGIPDMLTQEAGILIPPQNPSALSQAMLRLASDPHLRAEMGRAARKRYEELFSPQAVLPLLLDVYKRVASCNGASAPHDSASDEVPAHPWSLPTDVELNATQI